MLLVSTFLTAFVLLFVLGYIFLIKPIFSDEANNPGQTAEAESPDPNATQGIEGTDIPLEALNPEPEEEPFEEFDIHVMMVGDDLLHMGLVN